LCPYILIVIVSLFVRSELGNHVELTILKQALVFDHHAHGVHLVHVCVTDLLFGADHFVFVPRAMAFRAHLRGCRISNEADRTVICVLCFAATGCGEFPEGAEDIDFLLLDVGSWLQLVRAAILVLFPLAFELLVCDEAHHAVIILGSHIVPSLPPRPIENAIPSVFIIHFFNLNGWWIYFFLSFISIILLKSSLLLSNNLQF